MLEHFWRILRPTPFHPLSPFTGSAVHASPRRNAWRLFPVVSLQGRAARNPVADATAPPGRSGMETVEPEWPGEASSLEDHWLELLPLTHPTHTPDPVHRRQCWQRIGRDLERCLHKPGGCRVVSSDLSLTAVIFPRILSTLEKETASGVLLETLRLIVRHLWDFSHGQAYDRVIAARLRLPGDIPVDVEPHAWQARLHLNCGHKNVELQEALAQRLHTAPTGLALNLIQGVHEIGLTLSLDPGVDEYLLRHLFERWVPLPGLTHARGVDETDSPGLIEAITAHRAPLYAEGVLLNGLERGWLSPTLHLRDWLRWMFRPEREAELENRPDTVAIWRELRRKAVAWSAGATGHLPD